VSESDDTHYAVGSGATESSDGIPRVGDLIATKYRVDRIVGIGGMGVVLAVTHLQIEEPYAIKFLLPRAAGDAETVARFLREARAAVRIKSEHIARVSDVGQTEAGTPFIVMELLAGSDLGAVLSDRGPLAVGDAVEYILQACEGIAEAHALGIVHRDLKPTNLFLTRRSDGIPFVKVLDFGISKAPYDAEAKEPALTDTSSVFGSPAYMSPEQIRSAKNVDARSDVWSIGVILHELLTGRLPFEGETSGAVLSAIAADPPQRVRACRPEVPEALEEIVLRCLAKSPDQRFANVGELAAALDPFKSEAGIASIGRIQRLTNPPPSLPAAASGRAVAPSARPAANAALAVTEAPVTKAPVPHGGGSRTPAAFALALLIVGAGVFGLVRLSRHGEEATASVSPPVARTGAAAATPSSAVSVTPSPSGEAEVAPSSSVAAASASATVAPRLPPKKTVTTPRLKPSAAVVEPSPPTSPPPAAAATAAKQESSDTRK
jgi:serine/threonine-protein kinase